MQIVKPLKGFKQPNRLDLTLRTALPTVTNRVGLAVRLDGTFADA
jgi:hypothetical protein